MGRIKSWIESHASLSMVAGGFVGMVFPYGESLPNFSILIFLAGLIFFSCFKIEAPLRSVLTLRNIAFCVGRFAVFPVLLWAGLQPLLPDYATGLMLLALCPVAAAGPALTGLYGGNVTLAFALTVFSQFACIGFIPLAMQVTGHAEIHIPVFSIFQTLLLCVLTPCALFAALRNRKAVRHFALSEGRVISVLLVFLLVFTVIAKKRDYFLGHPEAALEPLVLNFIFYMGMLYLARPLGATRGDRIGYMTCSCLNNIALGAGLAFLYFDEKTIALMVVGEFVWSVMPFIADYAAQRLPADNQSAANSAKSA